MSDDEWKVREFRVTVDDGAKKELDELRADMERLTARLGETACDLGDLAHVLSKYTDTADALLAPEGAATAYLRLVEAVREFIAADDEALKAVTTEKLMMKVRARTDAFDKLKDLVK